MSGDDHRSGNARAKTGRAAFVPVDFSFSFYIPYRSKRYRWKLVNHRGGTPRFDKQKAESGIKHAAGHLLDPRASPPRGHCEILYVKESHMQSVSVSGVNYTARDVFVVQMPGSSMHH